MSDTNQLRISEPPRTLREIALEKVRSAIFNLHFKPGTRLTERDLGEQLGVSRSVVREVLRHLEAEGLIESAPNQGPTVARLDTETAAEIYELRGLVEATAAHAAALNADPATISQMETALAAIEQAYNQHDYRRVLTHTSDFYEAMFQAGGKKVAWEMVRRLNGRISILRAMTIASPGRETRGPKQLRKILECIAAGRADEAAAACRAHVASAAAIAQDVLRNGNH